MKGKEKRLHRPRVIIPREDELVGGEHFDFTDCIRHGGQTYAPAEVGHRTATVAHIGNVAMQLGRKLRWDPDNERCIDDEQANRMLSKSMRCPWHL